MGRPFELFLLAAVSSGCWSSAVHSPSPTPPASHAAHRANYAVTIADPLGFLPIDAKLVVSVDVIRLRKSPLWQQLEPRVLDRLNLSDAAHRRCGADLFTRLESVTIGFTGLETESFAGTMIVRGIDRVRFVDCLKTGPDAKQLVVDGDRIEVHGTNDVAFEFVDPRTMVAIFSPKLTAGALTAVLRAGAPLRDSSSFTPLFAEIDSHRALWLVLTNHPKVFDTLGGVVGMHPEALLATLDVGDYVTSDLHLRLQSAAEAAQLNALLQGQLGGVRHMFDRLDLSVADRDFVVEVTASETQVTGILVTYGIAMP